MSSEIAYLIILEDEEKRRRHDVCIKNRFYTTKAEAEVSKFSNNYVKIAEKF